MHATKEPVFATEGSKAPNASPLILALLSSVQPMVTAMLVYASARQDSRDPTVLRSQLLVALTTATTTENAEELFVSAEQDSLVTIVQFPIQTPPLQPNALATVTTEEHVTEMSANV